MSYNMLFLGAWETKCYESLSIISFYNWITVRVSSCTEKL